MPKVTSITEEERCPSRHTIVKSQNSGEKENIRFQRRKEKKWEQYLQMPEKSDS